MRSKTNLIILFLYTALIISGRTNAQIESGYLKGEVLFSNSESLRGFIWLASTADGTRTLYFKTDESGLSQKYSANDIKSFSTLKGKIKYTTEVIEDGNIQRKVFMQVHFEGELNLLSYVSNQTIFYIKESNGNLIKLTNPINSYSQNDSSKSQLIKEFHNQLLSILDSDSKLYEKIKQTEYDEKSITSLLNEYHNQMGLDISDAYTSAKWIDYSIGLEYGSTGITTDFDSTLNSRFPFGSVSFGAEMNLFQKIVYMECEIDLIYGQSVYDIYEPGTEFSVYYEDRSEQLFLASGILVTLKPVSFGKLTPFFSLGGYLNTYLYFSKEVIREELHIEENVIFSNYQNDFEINRTFFAPSVKCGINYKFALGNVLRLAISYRKGMNDKVSYNDYIGINLSFVFKRN